VSEKCFTLRSIKANGFNIENQLFHNIGAVEKVVKMRILYFVSFVLSFVNLCGSGIYV
jgi:hypothetical protein